MSKAPPCRKCGAPAAYYGAVGGYSVQCVNCNAKQSAGRRAAYKPSSRIRKCQECGMLWPRQAHLLGCSNAE